MWTEAIPLNAGTIYCLADRLLRSGGYNLERTVNYDNGYFTGYNLSVSKDMFDYCINNNDYVLFDENGNFDVVSREEYDNKYKEFFKGATFVEHDLDDELDENIGGSEMSEVFGNMFESMFGGALGYTGKGMVRLGLNGEMAVKTGPDSNPVYKTYNVKTGRLTNVTNFCFDIGTELFFIMPTTKVATGDILLVDGHPKCVIANNDNKTIKVMDYENSAIQEIVPERHVFMGKAYFYRKIVSMFGSTGFFKNGKGPENIMKLAMKAKMLQTVLGGKNAFGGMGDDSGLGSLMPMMVMSNLFGGGSGSDMFGDFSEMFDFSLIDAPDDDEADGEETEEELEAKLAALRAKKGKTDKAAE